jgi:peptide/nickel transport system permease protein
VTSAGEPAVGRAPRRAASPGDGVQLTKLIVRRVLLGLLTLLLVSVVIFLATHALPGDAARAILGNQSTPQELATLRRQLGLDQPLSTQYLRWLGDVARFDLGNSLVGNHDPVTTVIGQRVINSAVLVCLAALISVPISIGLGALSALKRDSKFDHAVTFGTLALAALPEFVLGILLIMFLSTQVLHLFRSISNINPTEPLAAQGALFVLPVLTLLLAVLPYITRMMRASTIEVLESDYIAMARLKGAPESVVMRRHAFPNALVPAIQGTAIQLAWLAGGIVVIEYLFNFPGIGSMLVDAVTFRNVPVIEAITLIIAAVYVFTNLAADILTILVSPRLRTGMR